VPARFHLPEKGYQLAERIAELEGIPKHVPVASSSQGHPSSSGLGRHPSSSGFSGAVSAPTHRPPLSGSTSASFVGRGQTLGGRPSEIHANVFRRRSATPPLFLDSPGPSPVRRNGGDDDELQFEEDMRLAMDLSRKESVNPESSNSVAAIARAVARGSGSGSASMGEGASSSRPAATTSSTFGGRRAALGQFASSSLAEPAQAPSIANVGKLSPSRKVLRTFLTVILFHSQTNLLDTSILTRVSIAFLLLPLSLILDNNILACSQTIEGRSYATKPKSVKTTRTTSAIESNTESLKIFTQRFEISGKWRS